MKQSLTLLAICCTFAAHSQTNTSTGNEALKKVTTGLRNSAYGMRALYNNTTGNNNTAVGYYALINNVKAPRNTAVGYFALAYNNAEGNTATGAEALFANSAGTYNVATGHSALRSNTTGIENVAFGSWSLYKNTGGKLNSAFGHGALYNNTTGESNTAVGYVALISNTVGNYNVAVGSGSLYSMERGSNNTTLGSASLKDLTVSNFSTAMGFAAGGVYRSEFMRGYPLYFGNTFIGAYSGLDVGEFYGGLVENATAIGYGALAGANQVTLGNEHVGSIGGAVSWTSFSDGRFKQDVKEEVPGLSFISKLRPVTYHLNTSSISAARTKKAVKDSTGKVLAASTPQQQANTQLYTGFIAQEVEEVAKGLSFDFSGVDKPKGKSGFYGLRYSDFVVPLVKAVQQLDSIGRAKDERIAALEERLNKLESLITGRPVSAAHLETIAPNPVIGSAVIRYGLPSNTANAKILITDMKGALVRSIGLNKGSSLLKLDVGALAAGTYNYTLYVDGRQADSKKMMVGR